MAHTRSPSRDFLYSRQRSRLQMNSICASFERGSEQSDVSDAKPKTAAPEIPSPLNRLNRRPLYGQQSLYSRRQGGWGCDDGLLLPWNIPSAPLFHHKVVLSLVNFQRVPLNGLKHGISCSTEPLPHARAVPRSPLRRRRPRRGNRLPRARK